MPNRYVVTGGAGFVGSHTVLALRDRGDEVLVIDNLRMGHRAAVPAGVELVVGDIGDEALLDGVLSRGPWDAVFHFAALSLVGESMGAPYLYLRENAAKGFGLIEACVRHKVPRFVLSSTANLFGSPSKMPIPDDETCDPASPYGESKHMIERALFWADRIHGLRSACLRYFNAAGADPEGRAGEDHDPETHLLPLVIDAALGRRPPLQVFGSDYPTPDGTCIRDYIHVTDLASAHLLALDHLAGGSLTWNLGNGAGHSVLEAIRVAERVIGRPVPHTIGPRRPGDPAVLVAAAERVTQAGWQPRFAALEAMIRTAYEWRRDHPGGYGAD
jgi:UDP-glucose 4-epimerase